MKKIFLLITINVLIFLVIDQLSAFFLPAPPQYYSGKNYYSSNYRNYFIPGKLDDGTPVYFIPPSEQIQLRYKNIEAKKNRLRIAAFGDSFTQGQGVPAHATWVKQLERNSSKLEIFASNYGDGGLGVLEISQVMEKHLFDEPFDVVIYGLVLNDPLYLPTPEGIRLDSDFVNDYGDDIGLYNDFILWRTKVFDNNRNFFLNLIYRASPIGRYFIGQMELRRVTVNTEAFYRDLFDPSINEEGLAKTMVEIEKMQKLAKKKKIPFLVTIFPIFYHTQDRYPFLEAHKFLKDQLSARGIDVLDLQPSYQGIEDRSLWVHPTDMHPNDFAHKIAAKKILEWLEKRFLVK